MRTVSLAHEQDFDGWREAARSLALDGVAPAEIEWDIGGTSADLFGDSPPPSPGPAAFSVPRPFIQLARSVIRHRDPERFSLLYALLLRVRARPDALNDPADPLVGRLRRMAAEAGPGEETPRRPMEKAMAAAPSRGKIGDNALAAWQAVREEAKGCTRCHLYKCGTQTVFGEGPVDAPLMLVGEQPGDQEDLAGRPFVGPAGQLLDRALGDAGIDRGKAYVTNAVKHFKFERRGKRRIHQKPEAPEIEACRWWLEQEQLILRPRITVALGATAARSLFGRLVTITATRGRAHALAGLGETWVTVHPSFLLRVRDNKEEEYARFVDDLARVKKRLAALA
jgi:uracil-DNA glycosylase family protein